MSEKDPAFRSRDGAEGVPRAAARVDQPGRPDRSGRQERERRAGSRGEDRRDVARGLAKIEAAWAYMDGLSESEDEQLRTLYGTRTRRWPQGPRLRDALPDPAQSRLRRDLPLLPLAAATSPRSWSSKPATRADAPIHSRSHARSSQAGGFFMGGLEHALTGPMPRGRVHRGGELLRRRRQVVHLVQGAVRPRSSWQERPRDLQQTPGLALHLRGGLTVPGT